MFDTYVKLYSMLDAHERRRAAIVLFVVLLAALAETGGVASIMPFIAVLSRPEIVESNAILAGLYGRLGFASRDSFLFFLGVAVFVVFMISLLMRMLGLWAQTRFSQYRNHTWSCRLVAGYLGQPYEWFIDRNSGVLSAGVLTEVNQVVSGSLMPAVQVISGLLVTLCLVTLLVAVQPLLAIGAAVVLGGLYAAVELGSRARLRRIGDVRQETSTTRYKVLNEALGGIKDVKVYSLESQFVSRYAAPSERFVDTQIASSLIGQLPSIAMQGILFGVMLLAILYLLATQGDFQRILPVLSLFAFAGYRLMPSLQKVLESISAMSFSKAALDSLCEDLRPLVREQPQKEAVPAGSPALPRLPLEHMLELRAVTYTYPGAPRPSLLDLALTIPARTTHGLVGSTGSGKTTIVDVVLGLLELESGSLVIDGTEVSRDRMSRWQRSVGYVPQQIYLADDTVEANIAFGLPSQQVDHAAVEEAAKVANLHDFVVRELPHGYATVVGERGIRLSGGQRQRIGIARALYRDPQLLILDEATSALDNLTERAVMEAVHRLGGQKTIILVAHRLSTVRECDCIHLVEGGRVVASGPYDRLIEDSAQFRALAEIS
jgi:ATP-binding cassette, subfamily B, bacterial PglK